MADIRQVQKMNDVLVDSRESLKPLPKDGSLVGRAFARFEKQVILGAAKLKHFIQTGKWQSLQDREYGVLKDMIKELHKDLKFTTATFKQIHPKLVKEAPEMVKEMRSEFGKFADMVKVHLKNVKLVVQDLKRHPEKIKNGEGAIALIEGQIDRLIEDCDKDKKDIHNLKNQITEAAVKKNKEELKSVKEDTKKEHAQERKRVHLEERQPVVKEDKPVEEMNARERKEVRSGKKLSKKEKREAKFEKRLADSEKPKTRKASSPQETSVKEEKFPVHGPENMSRKQRKAFEKQIAADQTADKAKTNKKRDREIKKEIKAGQRHVLNVPKHAKVKQKHIEQEPVVQQKQPAEVTKMHEVLKNQLKEWGLKYDKKEDPLALAIFLEETYGEDLPEDVKKAIKTIRDSKE